MQDLRSVGQMSASDNVIVHRKDVEMRCEDGLLNDDYYCEECYYRRCIDLQNLKKDYDSRSVARGEQQTLIKNWKKPLNF